MHGQAVCSDLTYIIDNFTFPKSDNNNKQFNLLPLTQLVNLATSSIPDVTALESLSIYQAGKPVRYQNKKTEVYAFSRQVGQR
jgi:hypothetical protein